MCAAIRAHNHAPQIHTHTPRLRCSPNAYHRTELTHTEPTHITVTHHRHHPLSGSRRTQRRRRRRQWCARADRRARGRAIASAHTVGSRPHYTYSLFWTVRERGRNLPRVTTTYAHSTWSAAASLGDCCLCTVCRPFIARPRNKDYFFLQHTTAAAIRARPHALAHTGVIYLHQSADTVTHQHTRRHDRHTLTHTHTSATKTDKITERARARARGKSENLTSKPKFVCCVCVCMDALSVGVYVCVYVCARMGKSVKAPKRIYNTYNVGVCVCM